MQCTKDTVLEALKADERTAGKLCFVDATVRPISEMSQEEGSCLFHAQDASPGVAETPVYDVEGDAVLRYPGSRPEEWWRHLQLDNVSGVVVIGSITSGHGNPGIGLSCDHALPGKTWGGIEEGGVPD